jgi:hypothetical protein
MSKFLVNLDLVKNELQNARIQNLASDPASPVSGQIYYNTVSNEIRVYNGTVWEAVGLNGVTADAAEINILDGATLSTAELNVLDGITSSTAELNILDGVTSTASELNLVDGSIAGTIVNSKAVVYGAAGEVNATTLQISGTAITSTAAELNILDGVTADYLEINVLDGITASTAELNILDGATVSASELNILDGATLSTTELNYVDGVTSAIQTQLDNKAPINNPSFTGTVSVPTSIVFEGATADDYETTLDVTDPTADRTITLPNASGTVALTNNKLTDFAAPTSSLSLNSQKITSLADPVDAQDAATKAYVDAARLGLDVKASVRVATTTNGTFNTSFANGSTIDGVTLVTGDRILIKNQSTGTENGIYTVNESGAPTRATDADGNAEVTAGLFTFVEEGTTNQNSGWILTTDNPITIGSTALTFQQFTGAGQITAGNGLTKSGNTISAQADGGTISISASGIKVADSGITDTQLATDSVTSSKMADASVDLGSSTVTGTLAVANGGTGATTTSGAKSSLGFTTKFSEAIGDGSTLSYTVTHNLGTRDVIVTVYKNSSDYEVVFADVKHATDNTVTVAFASAPSSNAYKVVVVG